MYITEYFILIAGFNRNDAGLNLSEQIQYTFYYFIYIKKNIVYYY